MMGAQRRVISAAFSVDSSANVNSFGHDASWAGVPDTPTRTASIARLSNLSKRMSSSFSGSMSRQATPCQSSDRRPAHAGRHEVDAHDHGDDQQDDGGG